MQLNENYWRHVVYALKLTCCLVETLRMVDDEHKPALRYIFMRLWISVNGHFQGIEREKRKV